MATHPSIILLLNGQEISRHETLSAALVAAMDAGPGEISVATLLADFAVHGAAEEPEPTPEPVPEEPEPEHEPEPVPMPDPATRPPSIRKRVDESRLLHFHDWNLAGRYLRASQVETWSRAKEIVRFDCQDMTVSGGGQRHALSGTYTLLLDGSPVASVTIKPGSQDDLSHKYREGVFEVEAGDIPEGCYIRDIQSENPEETSVPCPVWVDRGNLPEQHWTPAWTGSHEIREWFNLVYVPTRYNHQPSPMAQRETPHFDYVPKEEDVFLEQPMGYLESHPRLLNVSESGIVSTATLQRYFWDRLVAKTPALEIIEGPRGLNSMPYITSIVPGRARLHDDPGSPLMGNIYFTLPWSVGKMHPDGYAEIMTGFVHEGMPNNWQDPFTGTLKGDWSEIEESRRQHRDIWAITWLEPTLEVDADAEPIEDSGALRQPHKTAPIAIVADNGMDALRSIETHPSKHGTVRKVREFYRGESLWSCVAWRDKIIASERGKHRVILLDGHGNLEEVLLQGEALTEITYLDQTKMLPGVTREDCRAQPIVAPHGLYIIPGDDELLIGDPQQEQVRKLDLISRELTVAVENLGPCDFVQLAASDGTTGPRGTIFTVNWNTGAPDAYTPDGERWQLFPFSHYGVDRGRGDGRYSGTSYSTAVGCADGKIWCATVDGLRMYSLALPGDELVDHSRFNSGKQMWHDLGYYLSHPDGFDPYGLGLPWGEHDDVDYYLKALGH